MPSGKPNQRCLNCGKPCWGRHCYKHNPRSGPARPTDPAQLLMRLRRFLFSRPREIAEIADRFSIDQTTARKACEELRRTGSNIVRLGKLYSIEPIPAPFAADDRHVLLSDSQGRYFFGAVADTHLCSKYARLDVLEGLYDTFAQEGITHVYHAGNIIDGQARFNTYDLIPEGHGLQAQVEYLAAHYPRRPGMKTYFVVGDDHEGWYVQREGIDIGRVIEAAGRDDLVPLGYLESYVTLQHRKTGATNKMLVTHPGGGSAYAVSYKPQKLAEAFQGGEKPAIVLIGHYHKLSFDLIRNIWAVQVGCTQDQTPFARKKMLDFQLGGVRLELRQDPNGAIVECWPRFKHYFDRGYHEGSAFSPYGTPRRGAA